MSYELRIKPSAIKELRELQEKDRRRLVACIQALGDDCRPRGCEKLTGENRYRVRQGVFRVLYELDDESQVVTVVKIGHRREVYR